MGGGIIMSILDEEIDLIENTDYSKLGFPKKDNFITPNKPYLGNKNYYIIDNHYL